MRDEVEKSRQNLTSIPSTFSIPDQQPSNDSNLLLFQKQIQDLKDKLEQKINDLHLKENQCVTLKAKVDTYESKEKDLQHDQRCLTGLARCYIKVGEIKK